MSGSSKDWLLVARGLELVAEAMVRQSAAASRHAWRNSNLQELPKAVGSLVKAASKKASDPQEFIKTSAVNLKEVQAKTEIFLHGLRMYQDAISKAASNNMSDKTKIVESSKDLPDQKEQTSDYIKQAEIFMHNVRFDERLTKPTTDILLEHFPEVDMPSGKSQPRPTPEPVYSATNQAPESHSAKPSPPETVLQSNLDMDSTRSQPGTKHINTSNRKQSLSSLSRERKVPGSRISRLISFGSLGIGLGVGAIAEVARRTVGAKPIGSSGTVSEGNPFLTDANANRIVDTLCKVRGAALKLGQMLSLQDNTMINPQLQIIFERVRQSADFMPIKQMQTVLKQELGSDWKSHFSSFDDHPFAAASIGQVHRGTLPEGTEVAVKIQYPGVAKGIDSDIDNLLTLMNVWNILPRGLFVENFATVARKELKWEVDYKREAECARKFKKLVEPYPQYYVPEIIDNLSTERVLTSELIYGTPIDKLVDADQTLRNWICAELLRLALLEIFQFNFMQTDPNWSNFFFNDALNKINLLDFGACREYSKYFVDHYLLVIKGAIAGDSKAVLLHSKILGFTTGYESKVMEDAHVEAAMVLGEPFRHQGCFDFSHQVTTRRMYSLVPVMVQHRLTPPPEESYSIHRKLSGVFLLCARLKANIDCNRIFNEVLANYQFESGTST